MLTSLFGSQNLERILLFLFVNEKCYGTQLQTLLGVPLTPIQKGLEKLEKGGIVQSRFEGKRRIYEFSPSYPLLFELESLLKKAYGLLSVQEKKRYCFIHRPRLSLDEERKRDRNARSELKAFWERLTKTRSLLFSARARHGEKKIGKAEVSLSFPSPNTLLFQEKGLWLIDDLPGTAFSNAFRWTLDLNAGLISLEHLRYGPKSPVFLFHLAATKPGILESVDSHLCAQDTYLGNILWNAKSIHFHWRIIGPHKNDELIYRYC